MKGRIHPIWVEQGVVGTQEALIQTWCVTGLQGGSCYSCSFKPKVCLSPTRPPTPGVDTTDWNQSIHVSRVLLVTLGPRPCARSLLGMVGKAKVI